MPRSTGHFNVAPRFTPGSPALVNEETALRVALQERDSFPRCVEGIYGPTDKDKAERLGLRGIVEYRMERGSGKKHGWEVIDVCTGEKFFRLCDEALRKLGWRPYVELEPGERGLVDAEYAKADLPDHTRGHYKLTYDSKSRTGIKITAYRPELLNFNIWPWREIQPAEVTNA